MKERNWNSIKVGVSVESLLAEAADDEERDRLLAAGDKISGAWLYASPCHPWSSEWTIVA